VIKIPYQAMYFPDTMPNLSGTHELKVEWSDIIWAAVSVGKIGFDDLLAFGPYSVDEIRFRIFLVRANLMASEEKQSTENVTDVYVLQSSAYRHLDPSEKGAISYFLGMALGKLVTFRLLNVPWLVHLSKLVNTHSLNLPGRSRPDLAGQDTNGRWIICEAKGRTGGYSELALNQAKEQVGQVRSINGAPPHISMATEMYFDDHLQMWLIDPKDKVPDAVDLQIDNRNFMQRYYNPFLPFLERKDGLEEHLGLRFAFVEYESLGVKVGVWEGIRKVVDTGAGSLIRASNEPKREPNGVVGGWSYAAYPDGLAIGVDDRWSSEVMKVEPDRR
jgi:hypothetical protein